MGRTTRAPRPRPLITGMAALMAMLAAPLHAAPAGKASGCLIEPEQIADVGSPVTGVIEKLPVNLGDEVDAGQAVVMLRADVERANAGVAALRSQVDAEVRAARANVVLAEQKVRRTRQLLDQDFVSTQALEQAVAEAEVAQQKLKMAQSQQRIYGQEQAVAQAQLGLRTLRSPIRGVVVERYSNLGERVEDRPVIRVASIDPLRVSLMVPMAQYGQIAVGDTLAVQPELPGLPPVRATVRYVDKVVDAASNTFRVRLALPNPDHRLPGGLRCKADWSSRAPATAAVKGGPLKPAGATTTTTGNHPAAARTAVAQKVRQPGTARPAGAPRSALAMEPATPLTLKVSWTLDAARLRHAGVHDRPPVLAHRRTTRPGSAPPGDARPLPFLLSHTVTLSRWQ